MHLTRISSAMLALTCTLGCVSPVGAMDTFLVGPRAAGMGGANIASVNDGQAQYYNPAVFGFFAKPAVAPVAGDEEVEADETGEEGVAAPVQYKNDLGRKQWGSGLDFGLGYRQNDNFGEYIDDLEDIDLDRLSADGLQSADDLSDLLAIANSLQGLDDPGKGVTVSVNAGLGVRYHNYGIGVRGFAQAAGRVLNIDTNNLGLEVDGASVTADINTIAMPADYVAAGYVPQVFNDAQIDQLRAALGDPTGTNAQTLEAVNRLDFMASSEGYSGDDIQGLVDIVEGAVEQSDLGAVTLDENTTSVSLSGFGVVEIPLTYGHALNDWLSVGASFKIMRGRVYGNEVVVFAENSGDIIERSDEFYEESVNFGVDLGLLARQADFQVGAVIRNLNAPSFDGPTVRLNNREVKFPDITLDPQLGVGVAYFPMETLTLEMDFDVTKNETMLSGYKTQNFALGVEWDALRILALRAGLYRNIARSDIGWVYTAGLGLNLWAARLDAAYVFSEGSQQFDNEDVPEESQFSLQLSMDF